MGLDLHQLRKVKPVGQGWRAQCPACQEAGMDRTGEHLRIFPDGRWGCAVNPGDHLHRQRIWALAKGDAPGPAPVWRPLPRTRPERAPDWTAMMVRWEGQTEESRLQDFAGKLGVSADSLHALGCAWAPEHRAWAWPMRSGSGTVIGIRLRAEDGKKWAVRGSHNGLFWSPDVPLQSHAWIVEGPTDASAGLSIGVFAVGRASCNGGAKDLRTLLFKHHQKPVVIADNDAPGLQGARKLTQELPRSTAIVVLCAKDLRQFVQMGGTKVMLESMLRSVIWKKNP